MEHVAASAPVRVFAICFQPAFYQHRRCRSNPVLAPLAHRASEGRTASRRTQHCGDRLSDWISIQCRFHKGLYTFGWLFAHLFCWALQRNSTEATPIGKFGRRVLLILRRGPSYRGAGWLYQSACARGRRKARRLKMGDAELEPPVDGVKRSRPKDLSTGYLNTRCV
jgi:hypothetical protein